MRPQKALLDSGTDLQRLITGGGSDFGRPGYEISLHPHHLERFLARASEITWKNELIKDEWQLLLRVLPRLNGAWEKGQALFQEDLARARVTPEEMEYLIHIDFAEECYAYPRARKTYPNNEMLQKWAVNGYMLAWRQHLLPEDNATQ